MDNNRSCATTLIHDATRDPAGQGYVQIRRYPANISEASLSEFELLMTSMGFRANCPSEPRPGCRTSP